MSEHPLLEIQRLDNEIDSHRHAIDVLPERAEITELLVERTRLEAERDAAQALLVDGDKTSRRLEGELSVLDQRRDEATQQLAGLTSPKQAQAMQVEIDSLAAKISDLEDEELALLESLEPHESVVARVALEITALDGRIEALEKAAADSQAVHEQEITQRETERDALVATVDADFIDTYRRIRPGLGARAVVGFDGKNCSGCPLSMPAVEADRVRRLAEGTVDTCSECNRLVCR